MGLRMLPTPHTVSGLWGFPPQAEADWVIDSRQLTPLINAVAPASLASHVVRRSALTKGSPLGPREEPGEKQGRGRANPVPGTQRRDPVADVGGFGAWIRVAPKH